MPLINFCTICGGRNFCHHFTSFSFDIALVVETFSSSCSLLKLICHQHLKPEENNVHHKSGIPGTHACILSTSTSFGIWSPHSSKAMWSKKCRDHFSKNAEPVEKCVFFFFHFREKKEESFVGFVFYLTAVCTFNTPYFVYLAQISLPVNETR